jgi:DNA-binding winged helix-turn-helix (wHTH) protein/TolB-like protein
MGEPTGPMDLHNERAVYEFAGFSVDTVRRRLIRNGEAIAITSKAFDTLVFLLKRRGSTVTKSELMNVIWPDAAVEENNLTQQISALRRALGERPRDHRFIVTVPGKGYSFVADLDRKEEAEEMAQNPRPLVGAHFDSSSLRGYSLAIAQILLVAMAFAWSALSHRDPSRPQSLAVMNFRVSASGDEFIGNGISETLRARLGSVEDLVVRPATIETDPLSTGQQLLVDAVVTGSVQRDQDRIRVAVEMVDVSNGRIVWGKTFDDDASNIFALQDAIAVEVARVLKVKLTSREEISIGRNILASFGSRRYAEHCAADASRLDLVGNYSHDS